MTTVADLIREVRKPGRIEARVVSRDDAFHIIIEKADLLDTLSRAPADSPAPWELVRLHEDGTRRLIAIDD